MKSAIFAVLIKQIINPVLLVLKHERVYSADRIYMVINYGNNVPLGLGHDASLT